MKPYGSKRSYDTEPRIKSARALVKREGEALAEEQIVGDYPPEEAAAEPCDCDWMTTCPELGHHQTCPQWRTNL